MALVDPVVPKPEEIKYQKMVWVLPHPEDPKRVQIRLIPFSDCVSFNRDDPTVPTFQIRQYIYRWISELPNYKREMVPATVGNGFEERLSVPKKVDVLRVTKVALTKPPVFNRLGWHPEIVRWIADQEAIRHEISDILKEEGGSKLPRIMEVNRKLWRSLCIGPRAKDMTIKEKNRHFKNETPSYQTTDVKFLAKCPNPLNGNQPGVGKTIETIAAIIEGQTPGPWLVACPVTAILDVWSPELETWQEEDIYLVTGSRQDRARVLAAVEDRVNDPEQSNDFWVVCNPEMIRYKGIYEEDGFTGKKRLIDVEEVWSQFFRIHWGCIILDEFHRMGMGEVGTLTNRAFRKLTANKKMALSGTPMGGKPIKMFGILRWLEPEIFTSKHEFGTSYLFVENKGNPFDDHASATYGDVRPDREEAFQEMLSRYMVRHLKREVVTWLPEKQYVHHDCQMTEEQAKQYQTFSDEAEIVIDEFNLGAVGILAEYTRLKQFADAVQKIEKVGVKVDQLTGMTRDELKLTAQPKSGKLKVLEEILAELGLEKGVSYRNRTESVIIFTQFTSVADMLQRWLSDKLDLRVGKITGEVKPEMRSWQVRAFNDRELDVMVMNTTAGGVAINLPAADTVVFYDETWNPDDQEQAEDRCHRASKTSQVTVHYLRSKGTIEHYIWKTTQGKSNTNWDVLDARRMGFRANER